jgi:hypothetical protein
MRRVALVTVLGRAELALEIAGALLDLLARAILELLRELLHHVRNRKRLVRVCFEKCFVDLPFADRGGVRTDGATS